MAVQRQDASPVGAVTAPPEGCGGGGPKVNRSASPRDFTASGPNERWVADFTYIATWSGIVYAAFVVDVFSRAIVGWSAATSKRAKLVLDALDMALWRRDRAGTPR